MNRIKISNNSITEKYSVFFFSRKENGDFFYDTKRIVLGQIKNTRYWKDLINFNK